MKKLLFLLLFSPVILLAQTDIPPFEVKDPQINENFREIYYSVNDLRSSITQGVTDGSDACAGCIGEYISSVTASYFSSPGAYQFFTIVKITLTPGDWDVSFSITGNNQTGITSFYGGVGTADGNDLSGLSTNETASYGAIATANNLSTIAMSSIRKSITTTTIFYLKGYYEFTSPTPKCNGKISARRFR